ncbi:MAG TPA: ElyC/SanA/YdcF family protein [Candidatus Babeliaceae bacterium]|nr:ElyC/SanA/YdcF family protein [Candidatus Babeliaceae bacterium]
MILTIIFLALLFGVDRYVTNATQKQLYSNTDSIPYNRVGLLLGTSKYIRTGVVNPYYQYRIDAAVALYKAGKISYILVSGDNRSITYNEPGMMRKDLIARGVPPDRIYLDYAGVHTLDSIIRCRDIFGVDHFTIISQPFHDERALFIANCKGMTAIAYNAKDVGGLFGFKVIVREKFSRLKMMLELLADVRAKDYYGPKVEIK